MDFVTILIIILMISAAAAAVSLPFLASGKSPRYALAIANTRDRLETRYAIQIMALEELEQDLQLGKTQGEDYREQHGKLVRAVADTKREIRALTELDAGHEIDELLFTDLVSQTRPKRKLQGKQCTHCGANVRAIDQFCPACGKKLALD